MEALGRFELPTCGLGNRRSIHLSYRANLFSLSLVFEDNFDRSLLNLTVLGEFASSRDGHSKQYSGDPRPDCFACVATINNILRSLSNVIEKDLTPA